jgi:O-antigen ligase
LIGALATVRDGEARIELRLRYLALAALVIAILLSVTRGALPSLLAEIAILAVIFRSRILGIATAATALGIVLILTAYLSVGPLVRFDLSDARPPAGAALIAGAPEASPVTSNGGSAGEIVGRVVSGDDPSVKGHVDALRTGLAFVRDHPLGAGLGTSVPRLGSISGPYESALLSILGELGLPGGIAFLVIFALVVAAGFRAFRQAGTDRLLAGFVLVPALGGLALLPIILTSNVWGNFSVTFPFWYLSGMCVAGATKAISRGPDVGRPQG